MYYFIMRNITSTGAIGETGGLYALSRQPNTVITDVNCRGTELNLLNCPISLSTNCSTRENAVAMCQGWKVYK